MNMKRILIMLLIVSSAAAPVLAQSKAKTQNKYDLTITMNKEQQYPLRVFRLLRSIRDQFGLKQGQTYSVLKNPNTGLIESSERITRFSCDLNELKTIDQEFMADEPYSYQILHLQPGSTQQFDIKVVSADGQRSSTLPIRTKSTQEMWYLATKNLENPQLRDVYAIVWETDGLAADGTIYGISSLRPDVYVKNLETSKKTFKIEGRVDTDIKDSLYNIYIANTAEELENIGDDDYVACVPVINKRFEWQTELDHPVVGRLRCIFPDGELCSAWINLDFVPGETYRITVHNGYYDEDQDYERRVGRQSGKSLLNERQSRGIDDVVVDDVVVDDVEIDTIPGYSEPVTPRQSSKWEPTPEQMMQVEAKAMALKANMDALKATYASLEPHFKMKSLTGSERIFAQITKLNKELDAKFQDLIKYLKGLDVPPTEKAEKTNTIGDIYKEFLKFYTEQNQGFTEMYKEVGVLTKAAQKTQKYINGLTEKYLKEMSKAVMGAE
jgi:hypothetical protein